MCRVSRCHLGIRLFTLLLTLSWVTPARANVDDCLRAIAAEGTREASSAESEALAAEVLRLVEVDCPTASACDNTGLARSLTLAGKKVAKLDSRFGRLALLPRRAGVVLVWIASILGPGALSYYVSSGLPDGLRISFSSFVMVMSGMLFGKFSAPIEKSVAPLAEKLSFFIWKPKEGSFGQILGKLSETERFRNSQIYNQIIFLRAHFEAAGEALMRGNVDLAARHYANAIVNSHDMFGGLNLLHPATVREVRTYTPALANLSDRAKLDLLHSAIAAIQGLQPDELVEGSKKSELIDLVRETLGVWFQLL